jgi:hypothetical protein
MAEMRTRNKVLCKDTCVQLWYICHCTTSAYCRFQMYELCKVI